MGTVCGENGSRLAIKTDSTSKHFRGGRFCTLAAKLLIVGADFTSVCSTWVHSDFFKLGKIALRHSL
jgi:hypothetical protein